MVRNNIDEKFELLQHLNRVSDLSHKMAIQMGLSDEICKEIAIAAHLHDVGKLLVHPAILNKEGRISAEEKTYLQEHVKYSYLIGLFVGERLSEDILTMIQQHHENHDGTGYPNNLHGRELHIGSQIIRVADVYDALRSERPYRKRLSKNEAFEIMLNEKQYYNLECLETMKNLEEIKVFEVLHNNTGQNNKISV